MGLIVYEVPSTRADMESNCGSGAWYIETNQKRVACVNNANLSPLYVCEAGAGLAPIVVIDH